MTMKQPHNVALAAPAHHPAEEILLDYAAGAASASESALLDIHLKYCSDCRDCLRSYAAIGGAMIDTIEPACMPPDSLNRAFAAIDAAKAKPAPPSAPGLAGDMVENLRNRNWRRLPGGYALKRLRSCEDKSGRVWLLKAPGGKGLLRHRHVGDEWTVVLQGAFSDDTGRYGVGDFVQLPDDLEHQPVAASGEDCICLIMVRNAPRYTTLVGRVAAPFLRL